MDGLDRLAPVVVDAQQGLADPSWWGRRDDPARADDVHSLLGPWRGAGRPVVLVQHDSVDPPSPLSPGRRGNAFVDGGDRPHDLPVTTSVSSSSHDSPDLDAWLRGQQLDGVVVCGTTTDHCCGTTARVGGLGHRVLLALDATHTCDRGTPDVDVVPAEELARVTATDLHGESATVARTADLLA